MAITLRLPEALKDEAASYASDLGISMNALVAVALRAYLDSPARGRVGSALGAAPHLGVGGKALTRQQRRARDRALKKRRGG
jgi:hypothetical protein